MLADISRLTETLLASVTALSIATLAAVWRIGTILGKMASNDEDHEHRITRLEEGADAHHAWHVRESDR